MLFLSKILTLFNPFIWAIPPCTTYFCDKANENHHDIAILKSKMISTNFAKSFEQPLEHLKVIYVFMHSHITHLINNS